MQSWETFLEYYDKSQSDSQVDKGLILWFSWLKCKLKSMTIWSALTGLFQPIQKYHLQSKLIKLIANASVSTTINAIDMQINRHV